MKVVIAGGGTAGHVNPAIALARAMEDDDVTFIGTTSGAEATLVPAAGFALERISVTGFDRSKPLSIFPVGAKAIGAVVNARGILTRHRPSVVVGVGGYVSLPACLAAASARIPVVLHEQNIVLGLAHRVCKPFARRIAVSFEETLSETGSKGVVTGNPVAPEIAAGTSDAIRSAGIARFGLDAERRTLLVFGGSGGAQRINEAASGLVDAWKERTDRQVVHILGRARSEDTIEPASSGPLVYRSVGFVERMIEAYAVADLALCRGGATTLAELASLGLPSIIVPYPYHRDRQQERQARVFERVGAAVVLPDEETTTARIATEVDALLGDESRLNGMSIAARGLGRPDAALALAKIVREVAA